MTDTMALGKVHDYFTSQAYNVLWITQT